MARIETSAPSRLVLTEEGRWLWGSLRSAIAALETVGRLSPELLDQLQDFRNCLDQTAASFGDSEVPHGEA